MADELLEEDLERLLLGAEVPEAPGLGPDVQLALGGGHELLVVNLHDGCLVQTHPLVALDQLGGRPHGRVEEHVFDARLEGAPGGFPLGDVPELPLAALDEAGVEVLVGRRKEDSSISTSLK